MIYLIQKMTVVVHEHKRLISGRAPMDIIISSKIDEFHRRLFKFLPDELESNSADKLQQLEKIQQLDQQIASHVQLQQLKTDPQLIQQVQNIDSVLHLCKEQNEINRLTLEQSQLHQQHWKDT